MVTRVVRRKKEEETCAKVAVPTLLDEALCSGVAGAEQYRRTGK